MLSAIVLFPSHPVPALAKTLPEAIVRTLASLVPAVIEGVIRDLTIAACAGEAGLEGIADHAGCGLVQQADCRLALLKALDGTRESNIFLIEAGRAPEAGFAEELAELIGGGQYRARMRERPGSLLTRLLPGLAPAAALLSPRATLTQIAGADLAQMSRRFGAAPTLRLRARRVD